MKTKTVLALAAAAFALFYAITRPDEAAGVVQTILGGLRDGAEAIIVFLRNLAA